MWYAVEHKRPYDKVWEWETAYKTLREANEYIERKQPSYPRCKYRVVRYRKDKIYA